VAGVSGGLIPGSRLVDASPHKIDWAQTIEICKSYEFLVLYTSTVGFHSDIKADPQDQGGESLAEDRVRWSARAYPAGRDAAGQRRYRFPGTAESLTIQWRNSRHGKPLEQIAGACFRKDGKIVQNTPRPNLHTAELDALPFATDIYKRDLQIERYNVRSCCTPSCRSTRRGAARRCARSACGRRPISGHAWRTRSVDNVVQEVKNALEYFPQMKEIFFDDDTFNIRRDRAIRTGARNSSH